MATNPAMNIEPVGRAVEVSGQGTRETPVAEWLPDVTARRAQLALVELMGTLEWEESFDYKSERRRS